jgi:hypothetical protein
MLEHIFKEASEEPEEMTFDMIERFKEESRMWMADDTHIPFSTMIRWMSYGKGHRLLEGDMPRILLEEGDETLRYLEERITITDFQITVNKGLDETEKLLDQLMFEE